MLTRPDIARDPYGVTGETPRGFLPASAVLAEPGDAEYLREVEAVLAQTNADLESYGLSPNVTMTPGQRRGAVALAKFYAAEAVLMRSQTGTVKDPEGSSVSLSASDLAHWERLMTRSQDEAERYLGPLVRPQAKSGVFFAPTRTGGAPSRSRRELSEDW